MVMMCTGYTTGKINLYTKSHKLLLVRDLDEKENLLATPEVSYYKRDSLVGKAPTLVTKKKVKSTIEPDYPCKLSCMSVTKNN